MTFPVPELLERARSGDQSALNELAAALYGELRRIAAHRLRSERRDHTLQTTALVHEAYLKLFESGKGRFANRVHFLAVASGVMRHVLVDYARARAAKKRGGRGHGDSPRVSLTATPEVAEEGGVEQLDLFDLDRALEALARDDPSLAQLIEMRYFGGMTAEEEAEALGRSVHTVRHDLRLAQAWLRRELSS